MEHDALLMSLLIFVPVLAALPLCVRWIFPRGSEEYMRWWTLLATAATLMISLFIFVDFYQMSDQKTDQGGRPGHSIDTLLNKRAENSLQAVSPEAQPRKSNDWIARYPWIPQFNIEYYVGLDGISMALVLLTTAITFLAMLASWNIEKYVRGYCVLFLLLETGMIGTFLALDFFLFFIFWEVMLLPMYFLIGVWGGPRREYAAIKFFLYTMLGSVFILIAMLGFYFTDTRDFAAAANPAQERHTFDIMVLQRAGDGAARYLAASESSVEDPKLRAEAVLKKQTDVVREALEKNAVAGLSELGRQRWDRGEKGIREEVSARVASQLPAALERFKNQSFFKGGFQIAMFLLLFIGFAIKVPVFPFHTWLPDAHVEAPTPISMILAGVLLKMGGYGILRIAYPICPWAAEFLAWWLALFGIINIVYGAFAAMAQTDFKKLVAYSSVSHMGYVILGIAVWSALPEKTQYWGWGMTGAMYQMIAHGISSAGMFFLVGVIYDRAHHRNLDNFRGLYEPMPLYGGISAIIFFAALGLPGLCGFVGEFFVVLATWNYDKVFAILAALTVVITAAYILWTMQRVFLGTNAAYKDYPDITPRELLCIVPLVVLAVVLGVAPNLLLYWMEPTVTGLVNTLARVPGW